MGRLLQHLLKRAARDRAPQSAGTRLSLRIGTLLVLALLPLTSSCVGLVALPLVTGGGLMAMHARHVRAATRVPKAELASAREAPARTVVVTGLTELPPPSGAPSGALDDEWQHFIAYASAQAQEASDKRASALLVQPPSPFSPVRSACGGQAPAVVIDLDSGSVPFDPARLTGAPAELAAGLAQLRQKAVVILWISSLPGARVGEVARALRASGLDPAGEDQLLLLRNADDRKQLLRQDAARDVCIVAIAGDERDDFDELFDFLRNPDDAVGLSLMIDQGWFLVPSLTGAPSAQK